MAGRVVRATGRDTVAVAGVRVTLHRVTIQKPGPVDSAISDANGRFTFRIDADSSVVYLVSARMSGIEYFATPFTVHVEPPAPNVTVVVSDTSSTTPVRLAARHLIVSPVGPEGTRDMVDLFIIDNPGASTRVGATSKATWHARLPRFAVNVRAGNSDFSADAIQLADGEVSLLAAIPPGQRDIEIDYQVPPGSTRFELPVDEDAPVSNIVSADKSLRVLGGFVRSDTVIEKKSYARWQGAMKAGQPVVLEFGSGAAPRWILPALLGVMAVVLIAITRVAMRRTAAAP